MNKEITIPTKLIINKIFLVRGQKIILDGYLAELYQVETKYLKRQVRRNIDRFPKDFMFELTKEELENLRCQIGSSKRGGIRYLPMAFTEQRVAMLSSVLNSTTAIKVNIQIIRVFSKIRETLIDNLRIKLEIEEIKRKLLGQNKNIELVFSYLNQLLAQNNNSKIRQKIGYKK